jgi:hypothetical protein
LAPHHSCGHQPATLPAPNDHIPYAGRCFLLGPALDVSKAMAAPMTRAFSDDSVMVTAWLFQPIIGARDRRAARSALRRRTRRRVRQAARQPGACRYRLRSRHALCGRCRATPRRVRRQAMPTVENDQKRRGYRPQSWARRLAMVRRMRHLVDEASAILGCPGDFRLVLRLSG